MSKNKRGNENAGGNSGWKKKGNSEYYSCGTAIGNMFLFYNNAN